VSIPTENVDTSPDDDRPPSAEEETEVIPPASPVAPVVVGVIVLAVGVMLVWQGWGVPGDLGPRGPRFMPVVLAVLWVLLAAAYLAGAIAALAGRHIDTAAERLDHLPRVLALVVTLIAYAYAIEVVGYLISTSVLFAVSAAILGSRNHIRDAVIAVGLTIAVYFLFSRGLSIYLPMGVLPI
jgi:putative tricarboxylic transport membrane protein